jgi:integrase/recombinase XerD
MTPLRQQMIRELQLHRKAPDTVKSYVKAVEELARHYGRSPDQISKEQVRDFLHHAIVQRKLACSTVNHKLAAIQFWLIRVKGARAD